MHISLGLLWLCFQIIHGEIIRCLMGGVHDENLCKGLIDASVFNQFYKSSLEKKIRQSIIVNDNDRQSIIVNDNDKIDKQWNDALSIGTDTYRLIYHEKLLSKYNNKKEKVSLSVKEYMVLTQSYYNGASTHFFLRNYEIAHRMIQEGYFFFTSKQTQNYKKISSDILEVWKTLLIILKEDIEHFMDNMNTNTIDQISTLSNLSLTNNYVPSAAAFIFRRYFLDYNKDPKVTNLLESWMEQHKSWESIDSDNIYNKNTSMHYFLIFSIYGNTKDSVNNIIKAIQRPVLCVEDRLLNYEANKLALEIFKHCFIKNTKWTTHSPCEILNIIKKTNTVLKDTIIPKLNNEVYIQYNRENLIKEFYESLTTKNTLIEQDILHVIVTAAIDIIDIESEKYKQINANIKLAIKFLNKYVDGQQLKLNNHPGIFNMANSFIKIHNGDINKTTNSLGDKSEENDSDKCKTVSSSDKDNGTNELKENRHSDNLNKQNINYDTEEHMIAVANTEYSDESLRIKNIFIAFNWLAELNGVLCNTTEPNISQYQKALKSSIDKAFDFVSTHGKKNNIVLDEDHLSYLIAKRKAKILTSISDWEYSDYPGGWISIDEDIDKWFSFNWFKTTDKLSDVGRNLEILATKNSDCPYINKIELNILLYRTFKNNMNHDEMYNYIKKAINEVVITSEDRVRNMEAHELFSMYLMEHNNNAIKKKPINAPIETE